MTKPGFPNPDGELSGDRLILAVWKRTLELENALRELGLRKPGRLLCSALSRLSLLGLGTSGYPSEYQFFHV